MGRWIDCREGRFSFYELAEEYGHNLPLKRFLTLFRREGAVQYVHERDLAYDEEDLQETEDVRSCLEREPQSRTDFFPRTEVGVHRLAFRNGSGRLLGEVTLLRNPFRVGGARSWRIKDSFLAIPKKPINNHVVCPAQRVVSAGGVRQTLSGIPFVEKNRVNIMCAHATVRVLFELLGMDKITWREINAKAGITDPRGGGLRIGEMQMVFEKMGVWFGHRPVKDLRDGDFNSALYSIIESRKPGFIVFCTEKGGLHVVPVFGHTVNYDIWSPIGEHHYRKDTPYFLSSDFLSSYLVNDDNLGPYFCMHRYAFSAPLRFLPDAAAHKRAEGYSATIIGGAAKFREPSLLHAEQLNRNIHGRLKTLAPRATDSPWLKRLRAAIRGTVPERPVYRTMRLGSEECLSVLIQPSKSGVGLPSRIARILSQGRLLPQGSCWLTEISLNELFCGNRCKVGDMIYEYEDEPGAPDILVHLIRLPGLLLARSSGGMVEIPIPAQDYWPLWRT